MILSERTSASSSHKPRLTTAGFADPMMFYRYAFQFLVGDLLTVAWPADLAQDQQSTQAAKAESEEHLRTQNSGLAVSRLGSGGCPGFSGRSVATPARL